MLVCTAQSALAQESSAQANVASSIYGSIGAFGLSVGYAHRNSEHWVSRVQLNSGGLDWAKGHGNINDVRYEARSKTGAGFSTLTDYYPVADSGFHLTGGLIYSHISPKLTGQADGQGNYTLNHHTYSAAQVGKLEGRLKYRPVNVYLGGGWESAPIEKKGWRFMSDAGLLYAGKSKAELTATGASGNPSLQADVNAERERLSKTGVGLALSVGAAYSF